MSYLTPESIELVTKQNIVRPNWNQNPENISEMLLEENKERVEAAQIGMLGGEPMEYAGEVGDVLFLGVELLRVLDNPGAVPLEVMRAWYKTVEQALDAHIDLTEAMLMKVHRNDLKYPLMMLEQHNGSGRRLSKEQWKAMDGEKMFAIAYMHMGEELAKHG